MKWAHNIRRKIRTGLLLAAIFGLLFLKNSMDSKNVAELGASFSSVYEDRLLVESYIYRMSDHLFRKKIMLDSVVGARAALLIMPEIARYNDTIQSIIVAYEETKLTKTEEIYFTDFKENVRSLERLEETYFQHAEQGIDDEQVKTLLDREFNNASANLHHLSGIQLSEGKLLNDYSKKIVAGSTVMAKFEIGILIAIGLMIIVLVFESTSVFPTIKQDQSLN